MSERADELQSSFICSSARRSPPASRSITRTPRFALCADLHGEEHGGERFFTVLDELHFLMRLLDEAT